MEKWLLKRLFENEDQAVPRFAFQSTVNWMAALAIICQKEQFSDDCLREFYKSVQRRKTNYKADTWVFENILMSLHNIAALDEMSSSIGNKVAIVRSAIICWYYAIYDSSSAMVAASSGSRQEAHAATAKVWHNDIADKELAVNPFGLSLNTLIQKEVKSTIKSLRNGNDFLLVNEPHTEKEAWGAIYTYLSGTAEYEKEKVEEHVKSSTEFRRLGVDNFRRKDARALRDLKLEKGIVNFLIQSFRYRGKANYRDSIYLSYGETRTETVTTFIEHLRCVATAYLRMTCHYVSKRVEKGSWLCFSEDLNNNLKIDIACSVYNLGKSNI
jgi:hypothetical protein